MEDGIDKDVDFEGVGQTQDIFTESKDIIELMLKLPTIYKDESAVELSLEKLKVILNKYQDQPHLIDPYLENILEHGIALIRNEDNPMLLKDKVFKYIRWIINLRGYKVVVRYLPHEVSDMEPVLSMLEVVDVENKADWETGFVLVLWLSIIVKMPFAMSRMDGANTEGKSMMNRIFRVCQRFLRASPTMCTAAAHLSACFLARTDVFTQCLPSFLSWIFSAMNGEADQTAEEERDFLCSLSALAAFVKSGKREDLLPYSNEILEKVLQSNYKKSKNSLLRKYGVKVIQRLGLIFLKPKVASWRYQRGMRSLAENLKAGVVATEATLEIETLDEETEVPEEVEEVLEELMQGLRDPETVIRWSAAKGIGRVAGRLPRSLAGEVASGVTELLTAREGDAAWHGGCLALAELGRRGLLLPQALPEVLPLLLQALVYEDTRGYYSIGDHVRDAACYVAWAFARAYEPVVLRPYVAQLASGLLQVALFDREVKCRKAAAAAFQEHVGRQGTFPHGIDIVTAADYFTVAVRQNAYLNISVFVAGFQEYTVPLLTHVATKKVIHWDAAVRELAASALHRLTALAPARVSTSILPDLLVFVKSSDVNARHGALLTIGEVLHALALQDQPFTDDHLKELQLLSAFYRQRSYFSGMGGEMLRQAFCHLILKVSESKISFACPVAEWQQILDECLIHEVPAIRQKAAVALCPFLTFFCAGMVEADRDALVKRYLSDLRSGNQTTRMGCAAAISNLPASFLLPQLVNVVNGLLEGLRITEQTAKWAEARRECIIAVVSVTRTAGVLATCEARSDWDASVATSVGANTRLLPEPQGGPTLLHAILEALLVALSEYTQDARGDIGAWVREASMVGLEQLLLTTSKERNDLLGPDVLALVVGGVAQQAVERIDRTRCLAARVFTSLLHHTKPALQIPHRTELLQMFPLDENVQWGGESVSFPRFVPLLQFPCYTLPLMEGLVLSIGGLTERLVKFSSAALLSYLKAVGPESERQRLGQAVIDIFSKHQHDPRVILPLCGFLDRLLGSGVISDLLSEDAHFSTELLRLSKIEISRTRDFRKLSANMDLFCQLVQVTGSISRRSLTQMCVFLCYRLKAVRKVAAAKLYECLLLYGDVSWVPADTLDDAMSLLSDTNWEQEVDIVRPIRNKLCELMNVPVPSLLTRPEEANAANKS